jgi:hypothetical protein
MPKQVICKVTDCGKPRFKYLGFMSKLGIEVSVPLCKDHYNAEVKEESPE